MTATTRVLPQDQGLASLGPAAPTTTPAPAVRVGLEMHPDSDGERWIVADVTTGRQWRVNAFAGKLLVLLDGAHDVPAIAEELGLDPAVVAQAVGRFAQMGLLDTPAEPHAVPAQERRTTASATHVGGKPKRWRYRPPGVVELTLMDPRRLLDRLAPVVRLLSTPAAQVLVALVSLAGVLALLLSLPALGAELGRPATLPVVGAALALVIGATMAHELAHAGSLTHAGRRVPRLGFMLMYGSPAMFCDVSEAWRLPPRRRVLVALAGARVHLFVAGVAGTVVATAGPGGLRQVAAMAAAGNLTMAFVNLCPFVKFDGYIALIGGLDAPNLRAKCIGELNDIVARVVFGGRRETTTTARRLAFGLACAVTGPLLLLVALLSYAPSVLAVLGPLGGGLVLLVAVVVAAEVLRRLSLRDRRAASTGAGIARRAAGWAGLAAVAVAALMWARVPLQTSTVYAVVDGRAVAVLPATGEDAFADGASVQLHRAGIVTSPVVATGTVCGPAESAQVPVEAGSPVSGGVHLSIERRVVPLCTTGDVSAADGRVSAEPESVSLADWAQARILDPAIAQLP
ncbi:M50 family metallopeptidase [Motilibacter deserti]|uniref:M50 family metallopeptidase n=1 Tax=Motilibacter deserti TaxID=2714956 RepID=A0ABX0H0N9_9ACTN|nr:M50 family metallopeptidase [Motilibacter deserti]NHC15594.1 M50 family metallopeptidase [Motilibacter deserti]